MSCYISVSSYVPFKNYSSDVEISVSSYVPFKNYSSDVEISVSSYVPDDGSYDNNEDIDKNKYKDDKQYSYLDYNNNNDNNNDSTNGDNKKCPHLSAPEFEYIESGYGKLDYSLDAIGNESFAVYAGGTAKIKIKNLKEMMDNGVDVKIITGVDSTSTDTDTGIITLNIPNKNGAGGTLHDIFLNVVYFDNCGNYESRSEMYSVEELPTGIVYTENLNNIGSGRWEYPDSMVEYFKGNSNLVRVQVYKLPNNTTSLAHMCEDCYSLIEFDMNEDVDISGITDIGYAFNNCIRFFPRENSFLSRENNIENMSYAFNNRGASCLTFPMIYTKNVTDMSFAWANSDSLSSFPQIDTSNVTNMSGAWSYCYSLSSFPQIDTSNVTNMSGAWSYCYSLSSFQQIDTSNVANMSGAWYNCYSLSSFPQIDTSNVTNMSGAWYFCYSLSSFPQIDTSNVTNMSGAWSFCTSLSSFPHIDTSNVTNMSRAWYYCTSLSSFPHINTSSVANMSRAWSFCSSLPLGDCEQYIVDGHTKNFKLYLFDDDSIFPKFHGIEC